MDFTVKGMSCMHCVSRVQNAVKELGFDSSVDIEHGLVTVNNADVSDKNKIINAIEDLGFEIEK